MDFLYSNIIRPIFLLFDGVVIWLIEKSHELLKSIADANIFSDAIEMFGSRIYILLGIFMMFKLLFSLFNYLLNPDSFQDKEAGFGKLFTNVMVVLVLLVITPFIFEQAYYLQGKILGNNTIEKLILGIKGGDDESSNYHDSGIVSYAIYTSFFTPNPAVVGNACDNLYLGKIIPSECEQAINVSFPNQTEANTIKDFLGNALEYQDASLLISKPLIEAEVNGEHLFDYQIVVGTIAGAFAAIMFVTFCFDVAVRAIKLGFLQLIAPIPIVSYIDPRSSKDGMFKKWVGACVKTYLDLFIRLASVFFAVFVIRLLSNSSIESFSNPNGDFVASNILFVKLFIILGALLFAKQLPNLISEITGVKMDGSFTFNPMDKLREVPIAGRMAASLQARAGGVISGAMAGRDSGRMLAGAFFGQAAAASAVAEKMPWSGAKPGGGAGSGGGGGSFFKSGMAAGYKSITGKDFNVFSGRHLWGATPGVKGRINKELNTLKDKRGILQDAQTQLDIRNDLLKNENKNNLQSYQSGSIDRETYESRKRQIENHIVKNKAESGKLEGKISTINDQIKDIKRFYDIDESPSSEIDAIKQYASPGKDSVHAQLAQNEKDLNEVIGAHSTNQTTQSPQKETIITDVKPNYRSRGK